MALAEAFQLIPDTLVPGDLRRFRERVDPLWIEQALTVTGTATLRRRRLPAEQVIWLVIGMAILRNDSIERVAAALDLALPSSSGDLVARSALAQARQRLGSDPVEYLCEITGQQWAHRSAHAHRWRGLALYGIDGTTLRVPDSEANWERFGGQVPGGRGGSAYPTVRAVALMALRSHLIAGFRFGPYLSGELTLAAELWHEIPSDSLTIVDRGFLVVSELARFQDADRNRHWMTRAKSTTRLRTLKVVGRGERLVEVELGREQRRRTGFAGQLIARAIEYRHRGHAPSVLLTSLTDAKEYPATELVALYHERWELELGYDEVKTHMLAREETIRSRTPEGVCQEIWGIVLAYNLVRLEMEQAADEAGVSPLRLSFVNALALVRHALVMSSTPPWAPGAIPKRLFRMRESLKLLLLPPRRQRSYPRAVKLKMSNYTRKHTRREGLN